MASANKAIVCLDHQRNHFFVGRLFGLILRNIAVCCHQNNDPLIRSVIHLIHGATLRKLLAARSAHWKRNRSQAQSCIGLCLAWPLAGGAASTAQPPPLGPLARGGYR